jgi:hypothetical protein
MSHTGAAPEPHSAAGGDARGPAVASAAPPTPAPAAPPVKASLKRPRGCRKLASYDMDADAIGEGTFGCVPCAGGLVAMAQNRSAAFARSLRAPLCGLPRCRARKSCIYAICDAFARGARRAVAGLLAVWRKRRH